MRYVAACGSGTLVVFLLLVMVSTSHSYAGESEEACNNAYQKLGSGPYETLSKSMEGFVDDGERYRGCVIHFLGDANKVIDAQRPEGLFDYSLPYCPEGKLPMTLSRESINKEGWCADRMADGPDGSSYRVIKNSVFCLVEGHWDGGDDSDPSYKPSLRYDVIVKCAIR